MGPFVGKGGNVKPGFEDESKNQGMDPKEIGDEFRNITHEALSHGIMDPNQRNNTDAKKMADVMKQLDPNYAKGLDPEAKKQYLRWSKKPMKPMGAYKNNCPRNLCRTRVKQECTPCRQRCILMW